MVYLLPQGHLSHNKYGYCFRLKVSDDLQCYVGKKELRYSLKTGYLGKAKSKARRLAGMIQQLFKELREGDSGSMELSDQVVKKLVISTSKKSRPTTTNQPPSARLIHPRLKVTVNCPGS